MEEVDGCNLYIADNEIYEVYESGHSNYNPYMSKDIVTNEYELMQYIGFNDKNDKLIYESDIVKVIDSYAEEGYNISNFIGVIEFANGSFYVRMDSSYSTYRLVDLEIEVIGNIYENLELIPKEE